MSAPELLRLLQQQGLTLATAESCSGGQLAAAITAVPGASQVFGYGLVTYSNQAKQQLLQVSGQTLEQQGAVSRQCAEEMLSGLLALSQADLALVTTGVAGPGGGSADKPVGLVFIGAADRRGAWVAEHRFHGSREQIQQQTVAAALGLADDLISAHKLLPPLTPADRG